ncbi:MAG: chromate efflux transporter [Rhodospirillaceae bacterium]|nr:chromate efflux transporter [Rhodospirillaceae bacterium]
MRGPVSEVFLAFLKLGLTSFGGPVAHLGYFREEFVARRKWLDEAAYADLVALCQFLPGPASSQTGMGIGLMRAGWPGMVAAFLAFTAPSAVALMLFAYGLEAWGGGLDAGWLTGLKTVAVAVVAQAVWGMAKTLCPDAPRASVAVAAAILVLVWPGFEGQIAAILAGAVAGLVLAFGNDAKDGGAAIVVPVGRVVAIAALVLFLALLFGLPVVTEAGIGGHGLALFDAFYRAGALVFGGGHVVLPLLESQVVEPGWVDRESFLAGYGAAQAVPGPLFTFAAYLGMVEQGGAGGAPGGWTSALLCLGAIFLPSFLLVPAALPFWSALRGRKGARHALAGVNAAVVGLLLAALYDPVFTGAVHGPADAALALAAFLLLAVWRWPPWLVVLLSAGAGAGLAALTT